MLAEVKTFDHDWASPEEWAAMYRAQGVQVVPAYVPGEEKNWKRPKLAEWREWRDTLTPPQVFSKWYGDGGEYSSRQNMGLITGHASGNIFVIDIDDYKTPAAAQWWRGVLEVHNNGIEPETWQQKTGGGGRQLFFRAPNNWSAPTNKTDIGVDIRGQGGFAMLPPSRHESGNPYSWIAGYAPWECEIADAPDWLMQSIVELVGEHSSGTGPVQKTVSPLSSSSLMRDDNREDYMFRLVWAAVVNWYRECPIEPTSAQSQEKMRAAYSVYELSVKSRVQGADTNTARLESEGRGPTEFARKWHRAMSQWGDRVARDAANPPHRDEWQEAVAAPAPVATLPKTRFTFEKIKHLRLLPPAQWLVKGWVPEGATGIFYGKWATGKSFIGFDLALHLSYEIPSWHGVPLPEGGGDVLIIAREGHQGFVNRVDAFKKHYGIVDDTPRLIFMRGAVSFMKDDEFAGLCAAIGAEKTPYKMILVDTVARVLPGVDMNEQQTITLFMERLSVLSSLTGAAAIGVHHTNKSGGMMGSTFFEANADFVFEVSRFGEDEGPLTAGAITCTKMKDGEDRWKKTIAYKKVALSILPDGPSSLVVDSIGRKPATPGWPDREVCKRILAFIREEWETGKPLSVAKNVQDKGRYAPRVIGQKFEVDSKIVARMCEQWLQVRPAILAVETADKKAKERGLKVVGFID